VANICTNYNNIEQVEEPGAALRQALFSVKQETFSKLPR